MAKQGMKRPEYTKVGENNVVPPVPELQGKAKHTKQKANPVVGGTASPNLKVWHGDPHKKEKPISSVYPAIDNDLARDNIENDLTEADKQDL